MKNISRTAACIILIVLCGCQQKTGKSMDMRIDLTELKNVPAQQWNTLSRKKIYFGHQSLGASMLEGIREISKELPALHLDIKETPPGAAFDGPVFAHFRVGENTKPFSKCDAFERYLNEGAGERVDIAFFKFCYVDIDARTDVKALFSYYQSMMARVQSHYPGVTFLHCTAPLMKDPRGLRTTIKRFLGMTSDGGNLNRGRFNTLMREAYAASGRLFDLAAIESTFKDGSRCFGRGKTQTYEALIPAYTVDGGHLNQEGKLAVAEKLLLFLANLYA